MVGFKHTLCALLLTMVTGMAIAQNNTNSPYTRYGYGDLSDQSFGNSKAMGGIAFGLRDGAQINPLNPASYTAIDSLTFIFEGGVSLQNMNISGGGVKLNAKNSSFDYLAMQFRLHPKIAMSIGLLPFSNVGYSVSESNEATETSPYSTKSLTGEGGLHQLYVGAGVKVLKNLSVGVNASYFWGDITRSLTQLYPNTASAYSYIRQNAVSVSDYKLDFGLQYTQEFNKKHSATIGAVYSPKHKLNNDYTVTTQASSTVSQDWAEALAGAQFSQKQENEADDYGVEFCVKNGIDPYAMANALSKLAELAKDAPKASYAQRMFSSHPDTQKRIERTKAKADSYAKK